MHATTDAELIGSYAHSSDESAFAELAARHRQMMHRTCLRMLRDAHEAEDATQATFLVLAKKAGSLLRKGDLGTWLYVVARNVSREAVRARVEREKRLEKLAMWQELDGQDDAGNDAAEHALQYLDAELAGLPARQRDAVILRY
jgi:RNA polymerase sigma factor (sigma-70 family)